jgi:hypothetical protein
MLSFKQSKDAKLIAKVNNKPIYIIDDPEGDPQIETTIENKIKIFEKYLKLDKKLNGVDIRTLVSLYNNNAPLESVPTKLQRKFLDGSEYVQASLKRFLDFPQSDSVFPHIADESYRMFVSGLSGSGKSYFISQFIKHNPPKVKKSGIFLFSPVEDDKSLGGIKNLIHIDLIQIQEEVGGPLQIEHLPPGSILIFDDVESFHKDVRKLYTDFRDVCLERGRHLKQSCITVSHNARNGHTTKASIRECQYWVLFPKYNATDAKNILKLYGGLSQKEIDEILSLKSRWVLYKKSIPKYAIAEHSVISF